MTVYGLVSLLVAEGLGPNQICKAWPCGEITGRDLTTFCIFAHLINTADGTEYKWDGQFSFVLDSGYARFSAVWGNNHLQ